MQASNPHSFLRLLQQILSKRDGLFILHKATGLTSVSLRTWRARKKSSFLKCSIEVLVHLATHSYLHISIPLILISSCRFSQAVHFMTHTLVINVRWVIIRLPLKGSYMKQSVRCSIGSYYSDQSIGLHNGFSMEQFLECHLFFNTPF